MTTAIVVGSGPNGLAAAVALAQHDIGVTVVEAGATIGGGTRTAELTAPGVRHDVCSAVHPFAVASPFLSSLPLADHGLAWAHPTVAAAHPLDGGRAAALTGTSAETAEVLGDPMWERIFGPIERQLEHLAGEVLGPIPHLPDSARSAAALVSYGLRALPSAAMIGRALRTAESKALWAGMAAHVIRPFGQPLSSSVGALLVGAGHRVGWPVAVGGSASISTALGSLLEELGGSITTGHAVRTVDELDADLVFFDLAPRDVVEICADQLPSRTAAAFQRWKHGPAAFKIDAATRGDVPWSAPVCREAGTVHIGGSFDEIAEAERTVVNGGHAKRPFVLVGQQYLADPSRSADGLNPLWAYAHVPHASPVDATEAILDQFERFAPGTRDIIVDMQVTTPAGIAEYNANYVGGDILTGSNSVGQLVWRPRRALDPYRLTEKMFICSAATPPGAGVHGMCGWHAAQSALKSVGITPRPLPPLAATAPTS